MNNLKTIYLYRHGETDFNVSGITMGQLPNLNTKFTEKGYTQIANIGRKIKDNKIEIIYTSDFQRTLQTANISNIENNIPIIVTNKLNGLNMGKFQGLPMDEFSNSPEVQQGFSNHDLPFPKGESINQLNNRIINFICDISENSKYNKIALITHSAVISNLKSYLLCEPYCSLNECILLYKNGKLEIIDYCSAIEEEKVFIKRKNENDN